MGKDQKNLVDDERGAIMVIGLLMALSLIGMLWFLFGIATTIAFRDRLQDAADSAAFSQAACNARAMNSIAILNLLILVCVAAYLIASLLLTLVFVGCVAATASIVGDVVGAAEACWAGYYGQEYPPIPFVSSAGAAVSVRNGLATGLNVAEEIAHYLADGIALVAPDLGTAAGIDSASDFKANDGNFVLGIAVAETNVPDLGGLTWSGPDSNSSSSSGGMMDGHRIGLPVENEKFFMDCRHLVSFLSGEAGFGSISDVLEGTVDEYYCRGNGFMDGLLTDMKRFTTGGGDDASYWKNAGPIRQWQHNDDDSSWFPSPDHKKEVKSSDDWYQSYSIAMVPSGYDDADAEHKINLAQQKYGPGGKPTPLFYYAQAEFYFDCNDKWSTTACNNEPDNIQDMDMTLYSLNWRARLVRVHSPSSLSGVFGAINDILSIFQDIRRFANNNATADQYVQSVTGSGLFSQFSSLLQNIPATNYH